MGIFKQLKDARNVMAAAPGMIAQAQQMSATAQAYAAAQQQAYGIGPGGQAIGVPDGDPRLAPIAGVDLPLYCRISKAAATQGLDRAGLIAKAATYGVDAASWTEAAAGWPARMHGDTQLAVHYGNLYQTVQA